MPTEKVQLVDVIKQPDFWVFATLFIAGTVTVAIRKKKQKIKFYELCGEVVLASGMAFLCWIFGLYQNLGSLQIALLALPAAFGQVSLVSKLFNAIGTLNHETKGLKRDK